MNNKSCDRWLKRLFFPFLACPFHFYIKMCVLTVVNNNWVTSRTFSKPRYDISLHCTAPTLTPFSSSTNNSKSLTNKNDNQWFKTELEEFFSHWMATILITSNLIKRSGKSWQILTKEKLGKPWLAQPSRVASWQFPALATDYTYLFIGLSRACDRLRVFPSSSDWSIGLSRALRPATHICLWFAWFPMFSHQEGNFLYMLFRPWKPWLKNEEYTSLTSLSTLELLLQLVPCLKQHQLQTTDYSR